VKGAELGLDGLAEGFDGGVVEHVDVGEGLAEVAQGVEGGIGEPAVGVGEAIDQRGDGGGDAAVEVAGGGFFGLLDAGIVQWAPENRQRFALVFDRPAGRKILQSSEAAPLRRHSRSGRCAVRPTRAAR
jgi:hypothetical protein